LARKTNFIQLGGINTYNTIRGLGHTYTHGKGVKKVKGKVSTRNKGRLGHTRN